MSKITRQPGQWFVSLLLFALCAAVARADEPQLPVALRGDYVCAGSPADYAEVRHVTLTGTNAQLGPPAHARRATLSTDAGTDPVRTNERRCRLLRQASRRRRNQFQWPVVCP